MQPPSLPYTNVLVTGGAGFIGSNLSVALAAAGVRVTALDNLKRRGSELNLPRLREHGVTFVHGDIRCPEDLAGFAEPFDLLIECSAEPSVLAGFADDPRYVIQTNLGGTVHCLELARRHHADVVFFSTSRVYPIRALRGLALTEAATRFELAGEQPLPGATAHGVAEAFPLAGARTLYGATKLASELLIQEYAEAYGLRAVINRCGVVTGPWQMGRVDQGVFAHWLLAHYFRRPLAYLGYAGEGKQVRDLLHIDDLAAAIFAQLTDFEAVAGRVLNLGGGRACSLSLQEATALCAEITGQTVPVAADPAERPGDVPLYLSDTRAATEVTGWTASATPERVLSDLFDWVRAHEATLKPLYA